MAMYNLNPPSTRVNHLYARTAPSCTHWGWASGVSIFLPSLGHEKLPRGKMSQHISSGRKVDQLRLTTYFSENPALDFCSVFVFLQGMEFSGEIGENTKETVPFLDHSSGAVRFHPFPGFWGTKIFLSERCDGRFLNQIKQTGS